MNEDMNKLNDVKVYDIDAIDTKIHDSFIKEIEAIYLIMIVFG